MRGSNGATLLHTALSDHGLSRSASAQELRGDPFTLGVASGDPLPDGVVLWTRLALDPLIGSGGMPQRAIAVEWEIATDEAMQRIVQRGLTRALPELGHSVHVEVSGLQPSRWYWYRFRVAGEASPIGRTKTAPPFGTALDELKFAFVSCNHYGQGYYPALRRMAEEDLPFAVHLGDYIYEGASNGVPRTHLPPYEIVTIDDYRIRYGQYKSDPDLKNAHARFPWIVTWGRSRTRKRLRRIQSRKPGRSRGQPARFRNPPRHGIPGVLRAHATASIATAPGRVSAVLSAFALRQSG
jgi:alkaline phosphatase D